MTSTLLSRVGSWLVAPPTRGSALAMPRPRATVRERVGGGACAEVALLAGPGDVAALAALLALRLTRGTAVVGLWAPGGSERGAAAAPAMPGARRLAATLRARGFTAAAGGRLVTVRLDAECDAAAAAARRLCGAVTAAPVVLGAGGPRDSAWDRLLTELDLVVVHAGEAAVAQLAVARLVEQGVRAVELGAAPGGAARVLARAGLAFPGLAAGLPDGVELGGR